MSKELKKRLDRVKVEKPLKVVIAPMGVNPIKHWRGFYDSDPWVVVIAYESQNL